VDSSRRRRYTHSLRIRPSSTGDTPIDTKPLNVVLFESIHEDARRALAERGCDVHCVGRALGSDDRQAIAAADVIGIRSKSKVTADVLEQASNLVAIGCFCIGTNQVDLGAARNRGVAVFNAPFSNTRSVAELTLAEVVALHRKLGDRNTLMHRGRWDKSASESHEIRGRTLGIVGYGHIGSQVSVLAEAFGMRVIYYDILGKLPLGNAAPVASLEALLEEADVVTLHVPATETTRKMIGREEMARMKRGAFLINNARGSVLDVEALAEALKSGHLGGAAVDVFPSEPRESQAEFECPLSDAPNVILTPHIGGSTEEAQIGIAHDVSSKLIRFLETGSTVSAVNLPEVDLPRLRPDQHRILHIHHNVPGVLSRMHKLLAERDININAEYLQSDANVSYVILDTDPIDDPALKTELASIPETLRVRTLW